VSTAFRLGGQGKRLTLKILQELAVRKGWTITRNKRNMDTLVVKTPNGYIQVYKTGCKAYNGFERFGGNNPSIFIRTMRNYGFDVYSEHDDNFWGCRGHR
jgi:hypothetical protein